jgi:gas vesicle protein
MMYHRDGLVLGSSTLLAGLLVGLATRMLFAPYSGVRTRRRLKGLAEDWLEGTAEMLDDVVVRGRRLLASFRKYAA